MIFKYLVITIVSVLLFSGCTIKEYVYIESKYPRIEVLKPVGKISGQIDENGCICNDQLTDVLNGASQLRQSEAYYIEQVNRYNKDFTVTIDKD